MKIEVCKGTAGLALYVDDVRVAGPRHNGLMTTLLSAILAPGEDARDASLIREAAALLRTVEPAAWACAADIAALTDEGADISLCKVSRPEYGMKMPLFSAPVAPVAVSVKTEVSIKPMRLSDGCCDYFVSFKHGEREVTPHVFRERFKAEYHVALYRWLFGQCDKPDLMAFDEGEWPAREYTDDERQAFDALSSIIPATKGGENTSHIGTGWLAITVAEYAALAQDTDGVAKP